jgi:hypothetical protein
MRDKTLSNLEANGVDNWDGWEGCEEDEGDDDCLLISICTRYVVGYTTSTFTTRDSNMKTDTINQLDLTNRQLEVLRLVLGYGMSNHDDINEAYFDDRREPDEDDGLMVDGKQIDLITWKEVYDLLNITKQKLGLTTE